MSNRRRPSRKSTAEGWLLPDQSQSDGMKVAVGFTPTERDGNEMASRRDARNAFVPPVGAISPLNGWLQASLRDAIRCQRESVG